MFGVGVGCSYSIVATHAATELWANTVVHPEGPNSVREVFEPSETNLVG